MESQAQDTEVDKQIESNSDEMVIDRQSIDTTATATQPPQESTPTPSTSEPATVLPRSNPTTNSNSSSSSLQNVRVIKPPRTDGPSSYLPPPNSSEPSSPGTSSPTPTSSELKSAFAGTLAGRNGPNAPLMTKAMREKEDIRLGRVKKEWEEVKIRFRFSDRTQLETTFPVTSTLSSLYSFLPTTLSSPLQNKFTLYQTPPRKDLLLKDSKLKDKTLKELGFVPQAVIYVRFEDASLNETSRKPPLKEELLHGAEDCEPPKGLDERNINKMESLGTGRTLGGGEEKEKEEGKKERSSGNKAMPKWLMKGLKK